MQNELPATVHGKGKSRPLLPLLSLHREALCSARWVPSPQHPRARREQRKGPTCCTAS